MSDLTTATAVYNDYARDASRMSVHQIRRRMAELRAEKDHGGWRGSARAALMDELHDRAARGQVTA